LLLSSLLLLLGASAGKVVKTEGMWGRRLNDDQVMIMSTLMSLTALAFFQVLVQRNSRGLWPIAEISSFCCEI
jgi:hypothetical protein